MNWKGNCDFTASSPLSRPAVKVSRAAPCLLCNFVFVAAGLHLPFPPTLPSSLIQVSGIKALLFLPLPRQLWPPTLTLCSRGHKAECEPGPMGHLWVIKVNGTLV